MRPTYASDPKLECTSMASFPIRHPSEIVPSVLQQKVGKDKNDNVGSTTPADSYLASIMAKEPKAIPDNAHNPCLTENSNIL